MTLQITSQTATRIVGWRSQRGSRYRGKLIWRRIRDVRPRLSALLDHELREFVANEVDTNIVVVQRAKDLLDGFHALNLSFTGFPKLLTK